MIVGCEVYHKHIKYVKYTCIKNYYSAKYNKHFIHSIMDQLYTQFVCRGIKCIEGNTVNLYSENSTCFYNLYTFQSFGVIVRRENIV